MNLTSAPYNKEKITKTKLRKKYRYSLLITIIAALVFLYELNTGQPEFFIPISVAEIEVTGTRYSDNFSIELVSAVPIDYFYWKGGDRIKWPHIPPPRNTEIEFSILLSGEVENPTVKGSSGNNALDRETRDIIKTWAYNPKATGKLTIKINWIKSTVIVVFEDLKYNYPNIKVKPPYIGQEQYSFSEIGEGQPKN